MDTWKNASETELNDFEAWLVVQLRTKLLKPEAQRQARRRRRQIELRIRDGKPLSSLTRIYWTRFKS